MQCEHCEDPVQIEDDGTITHLFGVNRGSFLCHYPDGQYNNDGFGRMIGSPCDCWYCTEGKPENWNPDHQTNRNKEKE